MNYTPDPIDRRLLNTVQGDFPMVAQPYAKLGEKLKLTEEEVLTRIRNLKKVSLIRNIGAIFDTRRLGYKTELVAMRVDPSRLDEAAKIVNKHPGVSHNYERSHAFNLWFTIAVPPHQDLNRVVTRLGELAKAESVRPLPTLKLFKIGVKLDLEGDGAEVISAKRAANTVGEPRPPAMLARREDGKTIFPDGKSPQAHKLSEKEIASIRILQADLPLLSRPFSESASSIGLTEEELLSQAELFQQQGLLRRFAAVLYHRNAGFTANGMGVWKVSQEKMQEIGLKASGFPQVSHCYERPTYPDWPYSLFTMVHTRTVEECEKLIREISETIGVSDYLVLYSTKEYKKVRIKYFSEEFDAWEKEFMTGGVAEGKRSVLH